MVAQAAQAAPADAQADNPVAKEASPRHYFVHFFFSLAPRAPRLPESSCDPRAACPRCARATTISRRAAPCGHLTRCRRLVPPPSGGAPKLLAAAETPWRVGAEQRRGEPSPRTRSSDAAATTSDDAEAGWYENFGGQERDGRGDAGRRWATRSSAPKVEAAEACQAHQGEGRVSDARRAESQA